MSKNTLIISGALVVLAIISALVVLIIPVSSSSPKPTPEDEIASAADPQQTTRNFDFGSAPGPTTTEAPGQNTSGTATSSPSLSTKDQTLEQINDAMTTYSAEGVPTLQPLLLSSDPELSSAAIEAMKQLGVPEASAALRAAAKKTSNPAQQRAMLEAAEWSELPSLISPPAQR